MWLSHAIFSDRLSSAEGCLKSNPNYCHHDCSLWLLMNTINTIASKTGTQERASHNTTSEVRPFNTKIQTENVLEERKLRGTKHWNIRHKYTRNLDFVVIHSERLRRKGVVQGTTVPPPSPQFLVLYPTVCLTKYVILVAASPSHPQTQPWQKHISFPHMKKQSKLAMEVSQCWHGDDLRLPSTRLFSSYW